jgi:hypothetical protein
MRIEQLHTPQNNGTKVAQPTPTYECSFPSTALTPALLAKLYGAGEGTRTLDIQLGKLTRADGHRGHRWTIGTRVPGRSGALSTYAL